MTNRRRGPGSVPKLQVPIEKRFWSKVDFSDPNGCWLWTGRVNNMGYGRLGESVTERQLFAHRIAYAMVHGDIPEGGVIMHLCDTPRCVRLEHLKLGTQTENLRDMAAKKRWRNQWGGADRTHCPNGHEFPPGKSSRCRECMNEDQRIRRARAKAGLPLRRPRRESA